MKTETQFLPLETSLIGTSRGAPSGPCCPRSGRLPLRARRAKTRLGGRLPAAIWAHPVCASEPLLVLPAGRARVGAWAGGQGAAGGLQGTGLELLTRRAGVARP